MLLSQQRLPNRKNQIINKTLMSALDNWRYQNANEKIRGMQKSGQSKEIINAKAYTEQTSSKNCINNQQFNTFVVLKISMASTRHPTHHPKTNDYAENILKIPDATNNFSYYQQCITFEKVISIKTPRLKLLMLVITKQIAVDATQFRNYKRETD